MAQQERCLLTFHHSHRHGCAYQKVINPTRAFLEKGHNVCGDRLIISSHVGEKNQRTKRRARISESAWKQLLHLHFPPAAQSQLIPLLPAVIPAPTPASLFHTLIVETYRKINSHYPVEGPHVSPPCLIDDVRTPSHTLLLFIAPLCWSPFTVFLWQIITEDVIAAPSGE